MYGYGQDASEKRRMKAANKKYFKNKRGGSKLRVVFKKGRKRWTKYFKSMASMKRAKAGLKSVGWRC